jgi:hypothetical protein
MAATEKTISCAATLSASRFHGIVRSVSYLLILYLSGFFKKASFCVKNAEHHFIPLLFGLQNFTNASSASDIPVGMKAIEMMVGVMD